jgi:hypothetical protein
VGRWDYLTEEFKARTKEQEDFFNNQNKGG